MTDEKEPRMRYATINWFEHVRAGGVPEVFKSHGKPMPVPGDGIFCEVEAEGITFACTILANGHGDEVQPGTFELALNTMLAALRNSVDAPQPKGVYIIPEGEAN